MARNVIRSIEIRDQNWDCMGPARPCYVLTVKSRKIQGESEIEVTLLHLQNGDGRVSESKAFFQGEARNLVEWIDQVSDMELDAGYGCLGRLWESLKRTRDEYGVYPLREADLPKLNANKAAA